MHVAPYTPPMSLNSSSQQIWLTNLAATNHMTTDLQNLSMSTPYPTFETIQTVNGAGLPISHIGSSILHAPIQPLKLNSVLYVSKITHNLLSVHKMCLDSNCWLIFKAFDF